MQIFLIDDHAIVLEAMESMFNSKFGPGTVKTVKVDDLSDVNPVPNKLSIAFLDLNFHGELNGLQHLRSLKLRSIRTAILSMHSEPEIIQKAIEAGADGYILKTDEPSELFEAVESLRSGRRFLSKSVQRILATKPTEAPKQLSKREKEIALLVANGKTSRQIAESLFISIRTVEVHRTNIMKKLGVKNTAQLVACVAKMRHHL